MPRGSIITRGPTCSLALIGETALVEMAKQHMSMMTALSATRHTLVQWPVALATRMLNANEINRSRRQARPYIAAVFSVAGIAMAMLAVRDSLDILNVGLLFLLVVFAQALALGSGPAALAAILSFLAFNFLFIPPFHTLSVDSLNHVLALVVYLGVAISTGQLVARVRARTEIAQREQRRTALLFELNAALIGEVKLDSILSTIVLRVVQVYGAGGSRILLPDKDGILMIRASFPAQSGIDVERHHLSMATWVMEHRTPAGSRARGSKLRWPHGPGSAQPVATPTDRAGTLYLPIATTDRVVGVLEVTGRPESGRFEAEDRALLSTFANQAALALERTRLTEREARAAALEESEELKSALLAAVSHDLRTPLATIKTSVTSLLDSEVDWSDRDRSEFLQAIDEETDRLARLVENLLDLSRIEGGAVQPFKDWHAVPDLIEDVASRLTALAGQSRVISGKISDLPLWYFDYGEISRVLMNLGDNALKYSPPGTPITLSARALNGALQFSVGDRGPGMPAHFLPHMFDKFSRADPGGRIPGSGLGLAISKGLVEAHGGAIWAESEQGKGTTIHLTLPAAGNEGTAP